MAPHMKILVVDDEWGSAYLEQIKFELTRRGYHVDGTSTFDCSSVLEAIRLLTPQVLVLDIISGGQEAGLGLFQELGNSTSWKALSGSVQIVFCSGEPSARRHAVVGRARRIDVAGFISKADLLAQRPAALSILENAAKLSDFYRVAPEMANPKFRECSALIFSPNSVVMHEVWKKVILAGRCHEPVFISGETGTGKELVAKAIFDACKIVSDQRAKGQEPLRGSGDFLPVNIAAVASEGNLQYVELFGYEKGTFNDAREYRKGLFEKASEQGKTAGKAGAGPGATVFLDEIGDAHPSVQTALLRVLQEGQITPMGGAGTTPKQVRFRLITASHSLLGNMARGLFRPDLYMRLNGIHIHLPPLRERQEDVEVLAYVFLEKLNEEYGKLGWSRKDLNEDVLSRLKKFEWTGNVRELEMAIRNSYVLSPGSRLEFPDDLLRKLEGRGLMHHAEPAEIVDELIRRPEAIVAIMEQHGEPIAVQVLDLIKLRHQIDWTDDVAQRYFGSEANTEALRKWRERHTKSKKSATSRRASEGS